MLHAQLAAAALATASLAAAGCGGSSKTQSVAATSTTAASSAPASSAQASPPPVTTNVRPATGTKVKIASGAPLPLHTWIAKSNEICARLSAELGAIKVSKTAEIVRVLPQAAAYERAAVLQLARLVPPASRVAGWQRYLDIMMERSQDSLKIVQLASLGDAISRAPIFAAVSALQHERRAIAQRAGVDECASV